MANTKSKGSSKKAQQTPKNGTPEDEKVEALYDFLKKRLPGYDVQRIALNKKRTNVYITLRVPSHVSSK